MTFWLFILLGCLIYNKVMYKKKRHTTMVIYFKSVIELETPKRT